MNLKFTNGTHTMVQLLAALAPVSMAVSLSLSTAAQGSEVKPGNAPAVLAHKASPYSGAGAPTSAKAYLHSAWGIDHVVVHTTASGTLIRFSYRVTDAVRAKPLGDSRATPLMFGQRSRALLHVPVMEKVGQLRQTGAQVAGQEYWMVFSNKGHLVKPGDQVSVVIGSFHAEGLMVE